MEPSIGTGPTAPRTPASDARERSSARHTPAVWMRAQASLACAAVAIRCGLRRLLAAALERAPVCAGGAAAQLKFAAGLRRRQVGRQPRRRARGAGPRPGCGPLWHVRLGWSVARYYATCLYACVCAQVLVAAAKSQEGCDDGRLAAAPALVPRARRAQRSGRFGSGCGELGSVAESALNEAVLKAHVNEPTGSALWQPQWPGRQ